MTLDPHAVIAAYQRAATETDPEARALDTSLLATASLSLAKDVIRLTDENAVLRATNERLRADVTMLSHILAINAGGRA